MTKQIFLKINLGLLSFLLLFSAFALSFANGASAADANSLLWGGKANDIQNRTQLGNDDPRNIAANVINIILGFLGILAVALILFGGFKWMTAMGNDDKIKEAKNLLVAGVIGLIIILSAFSLASFVLDAVFTTTRR